MSCEVHTDRSQRLGYGILVGPLSLLLHPEGASCCFILISILFPWTTKDPTCKDTSYQGKRGESKCKPKDLEICQNSYKYEERKIRMGAFVLKWTLFLYRNVPASSHLFSQFGNKLFLPLSHLCVRSLEVTLNTFRAAVLNRGCILESPAMGSWGNRGFIKLSVPPNEISLGLEPKHQDL